MPSFPSAGPDLPPRPLLPAKTHNARYPLSARMTSGNWHYNGNHESAGEGSLKLLDTQTQLWFRYRCAYSFELHGDTYAARWIKPGQTLEILMSKPASHRTTSCRLTTHV